jgi:hypothetical protein
MELIKLSSAIGSVLAGMLILALWIAAANDKGAEDGTRYKCRGCVQLYHDGLPDTDIGKWLKDNRSPYNILIAFGVILGVMWMGTGALGFFANNPLLAKIYLGAGIGTYLIHVILFPTIVMRFSTMVSSCTAKCSNADDWATKHMLDSYEEFWGASLVCFVLGAYQIIAAVYHHNCIEGSKPAGAPVTS